LEPHEKVRIDKDFLDEDVHGKISCAQCHGGNPKSSEYKAAHAGVTRDPSFPDPAKTCGECHVAEGKGHPEITGKNKTNLHITLSPFRNKIYLRANPDPGIRAKIDSAMGTHCLTCHSSCGQCHVSRPNSVEGGLVDGHLFKKTPPIETNCTSCHGSRVGQEFRGENEGIPADVHCTEAQMTCMACHSGNEMHGTGAGPVPFDRYEVANRARCQDCHAMKGAEAAKSDKKAKSLEHPSHAIHQGKVTCHVCHSVPYKNCYSCHVGKDKSGLPYFETAPSKMDFKIGLNPKPTAERPEKYATVRHVPASPGLFDFYVKDALTNMDKAPTWTFATPHNIQLKTPQNKTCLSCHGNNALFLTGKDAEGWEVEANKNVFVPLKPPPSVRHAWLEKAELHLQKVDCLTCHNPALQAPVKDCRQCHSPATILVKTAAGEPGYALTDWGFTNRELIEKGLYVVGSNRIPALDLIGFLLILFTFAGCALHGALRFIGKRRR
jgi:thiosulfate/3-mercaptopyruvate sulfurtransferase